jgi:hypothetical protein
MANGPEKRTTTRHSAPSLPESTPGSAPLDAQTFLGNAAMQGLIRGRSDHDLDPTALAEGLTSGDAPAPFFRAATASGDLGFTRAYIQAVHARRTQIGSRNRDEEDDDHSDPTPE